MRMVSVAVEDILVEKIDSVVRVSGLYSSRSEFLKDSIRLNLARASLLDSELEVFRKKTKEFREIVRSKVGEPKFLTSEEKTKIAKEWLKENKVRLE